MFRSVAPERKTIKPVSDEVVDLCLPQMPTTVAAMVQIQRQTGMRPAEVVSMKGAHVTMSAGVWVYSLPRHKNAWRAAGPSGSNLWAEQQGRGFDVHLPVDPNPAGP